MRLVKNGKRKDVKHFLKPFSTGHRCIC